MSKGRKPFYHASKSSPTIVLTQAELNRIKNEARKEAVNKISKFDVEVLFTCFAQSLRDNYGWGHKRLFRTLNSVDEMFGRVLAGELSDEDMRQRLLDECGILIDCDGGANIGSEIR